jgi:hypothetical protein
MRQVQFLALIGLYYRHRLDDSLGKACLPTGLSHTITACALLVK